MFSLIFLTLRYYLTALHLKICIINVQIVHYTISNVYFYKILQPLNVKQRSLFLSVFEIECTLRLTAFDIGNSKPVKSRTLITLNHTHDGFKLERNVVFFSNQTRALLQRIYKEQSTISTNKTEANSQSKKIHNMVSF